MTIKQTTFCLAIAALGFASCQQNQHADTSGDKNTVSIDTSSLDTLSYNVALSYVHNYAKHAGTVDSSINENGVDKVKKRPNTRCVWFPIKRLRKLVDSIDKQGGDGIRFYLATYDSLYTKDFKGHVPDKKYWGYNTLVMVSTKDSLNHQYHQDYYNNKPKPGQNGGVMQGFIVGTTPENRGEQCPPPLTCGKIGATLIKD